MKYEMRPVISSTELRNEIRLQYDIDISDICDFLFGDESCSLNEIDLTDPDEVYSGSPWDDEEEISWRNLVKAHLRDIFPNNKLIIVENTWWRD